jgi:hypothetical protein
MVSNTDRISAVCLLFYWLCRNCWLRTNIGYAYADMVKKVVSRCTRVFELDSTPPSPFVCSSDDVDILNLDPIRAYALLAALYTTVPSLNSCSDFFERVPTLIHDVLRNEAWIPSAAGVFVAPSCTVTLPSSLAQFEQDMQDALRAIDYHLIWPPLRNLLPTGTSRELDGSLTLQLLRRMSQGESSESQEVCSGSVVPGVSGCSYFPSTR